MVYFHFKTHFKMIRIAKPEDAAGILAIYSPFILQSGITQETEVPTQTNFEQRIRTGLHRFPWLVAEQNGEITGYAYAGSYRERAGYRWCCETSIYLSSAEQHTGLAQKLYSILLGILRLQGFFKAYAVITLPNVPSIRFHEKNGFRYFATYTRVGYKLGSWHDVGWMEYDLQEEDRQPREPILFSELEAAEIQQVLSTVADS